MNRRRFLAATSAGVAGGLSGCLALGADRPSDSTATAVPETSAGEEPSTGEAPGNVSQLARQGQPPTICSKPILEGFSIRAILEPAVADGWTGAKIPEQYGRGEGRRVRGIGSEARIIGVTREKRARAYPLSVVAEHEIVNDEFGGPLLVTYCPRCQSGLTAKRLVDDSPTMFHVSGNLWKISGSDDNLVMYDAATESYWSQIVATAICGPKAGSELSLVPSEFTTWSDWVSTHPDTDVLLPPPSRTDATG